MSDQVRRVPREAWYREREREREREIMMFIGKPMGRSKMISVV